jgi:hypothetical protein
VDAESVYIDWGKAQTTLSWEWPLRIGYLPDDASLEFIESIGDLARKNLFRIVDVAQRRQTC